jgi:23S rRNA pseudouridine1911/1915/1917 synthase
MQKHHFTTPENLHGSRLDKAASELSGMTRSRIQQLIKSGDVTVNGKLMDGAKTINTGDEIMVNIPPPVDTTMRPSNIPLNVVYEDDHLLVINKQAGLTVHPGAGQHTDTMANALLTHCGDSLSGIGGVTRPGIVHRLDRDTSGLMIVAKNDVAHVSLSEQIASRELKRVYQAIVWGVPIPHSGTIDANLDRNVRDRTLMRVVKTGGKTAITHYKVLKILGATSLVECRLETGRTHQIRVHMSHIAHSIFGDQSYGHNARKIAQNYKGEVGEELKLFKRQALHSCFIEFTHPVTEETMSFSAEMPEDMQNIAKKLVN